jgi:hypothetical protein
MSSSVNLRSNPKNQCYALHFVSCPINFSFSKLYILVCIFAIMKYCLIMAVMPGATYCNPTLSVCIGGSSLQPWRSSLLLRDKDDDHKFRRRRR